MAITKAQVNRALAKFMDGLRKRNAGETEFHHAVEEVATSVMPFVLANPQYVDAQILERMTEPDRIVSFRVSWETDDGQVRANRAWRVQFNNSIGPYKGGLRFHPTVNESVLKFLGFEQTFKNALTGLPMGGAKGGSNFNPRGKSDREVMRFCQSLMVELQRHIGEHVDVPAGDIGVGGREISYLFGMYKRLSNRFVGTLTGKGLSFGGSHVRVEATGYGCVYFVRTMLRHHDDDIAGKTIAISGSGNVALYAAEKAIELGAKVVALSDSDGCIHDPGEDGNGIDRDRLEWTKELKEKRRGRIAEYAEKFATATYRKGKSPWEVGVPCQIALPCATQDELDGVDAKRMIKAGTKLVAEGANMPCTADAVAAFRERGVLFAPGKAANAGGVAVSGLEQSQNALRLSWSRQQVDERLQAIMDEIHAQCVRDGVGAARGPVDYVKGANLASFRKVGEAMLAYGVV